MKIAVIGTGYVGLVSGTCFAETGITVTCVDIDKTKIDRLNNGDIPIYEPGLERLVNKNRETGRLSFTSKLEESIADFTRTIELQPGYIKAYQNRAAAYEALGDKAKVLVFGSSQLGKDKQLLQKLKLGQVTFSLPSSSGVPADVGV